ncbi:MAG: carboxynorspermidine decarboxylase [Bacteroidaceae bacterium]|nr:carboxynorspermidine decarboxylase [Bacteroidaceae bacterium]
MSLLEENINSIPSPCYVMEEDLLRRNLSLIKSVAERADVEIILAFKAFALWKSFPIFREYIEHTTASSPYEARLAFEEFGSPAHTYSPAYEEDTFPEILRCSNHITLNSLSQYERFNPLVKQYQIEKSGGEAPSHSVISLGLRVNPEYSEIETELYNPCAPGSRFGILASQLPSVLPDGIEGFHIHCHCESGADAFARTLQHIEEKFSIWFPQIQWINFGGGHLMTRKDYDVELLIKTLQGFHQRYPHLKVILEPGSAFAWETGPLVSRVVDIVENKGIQTAILNVSFTCHMPDCLEMPYHPAVRGAETIEDISSIDESINRKHLYRLGGNSCLSGDFMGYWLFDHPLEIGENIIFEDMIHYTTVKTNMFNGIHHPAIGLLHSDGTFELYRYFTYEDYKNRMC